jgi:isoamylase
LRREHPVLRRRRHFFRGRRIRGSEVKDLSWHKPDGNEMTDDDWQSYTRCLGIRLAGDAIDEVDPAGQRIVDDTLLVLINAHHEPLDFVLPTHTREVSWETLLDTRGTDDVPRETPAGKGYPLGGRSLALLRQTEPTT